MAVSRTALIGIYKELHSAFGPQHWWPADTDLEVMVGAILTQNTNWGNVEKAIGNLKRARLLSLEALVRVPRARLARLIRPAGYFNSKSDHLKHLVRFLSGYRGGIKAMKRADVPGLRARLLAVKGVGPETADSILLYALDKPVFVIDAYTKRIFSRHGFIDADAAYDNIQKLFMGALPRDVRIYNEYHALIVRLAKEHCSKTKPRCAQCPLAILKKGDYA